MNIRFLTHRVSSPPPIEAWREIGLDDVVECRAGVEQDLWDVQPRLTFFGPGAG
jgi:hypothetical protein